MNKSRFDVNNKNILCYRIANFADNYEYGTLDSGLLQYATNLLDASLTWDDVKWLKR